MTTKTTTTTTKNPLSIFRVPVHPKITKRITRAENLSDERMARVRVHFDNGLQLSVIKGNGVHGDKERPFEVALLDEHDNFVTKTYFLDAADDVIGYQTEINVLERMVTVSKIWR